MDEYKELLKLILTQKAGWQYVDLDAPKKQLVLDTSIYDLTDRQIELLSTLMKD